MSAGAILQVEDVSKHYRLHRSLLMGHDFLFAVDQVSFKIREGESFGIVGESGSGKSTLVLLIAMLESLTSGKIYFDGQDTAAMSKQEKRQVRRNLQIVFQDAYSSLNPRFSVRETLSEPIKNFSLSLPVSLEDYLAELLERVGLSKNMMERYPSELSGGERQRVCIARALALKPRLIIFDEATSGLDVTLQNQILRLLLELKQELNLTYLFVTHNLHIIPVLTETVAVMHQGRIVETLDSSRLSEASHPYSKELLSSIPAQHPRFRRIIK